MELDYSRSPLNERELSFTRWVMGLAASLLVLIVWWLFTHPDTVPERHACLTPDHVLVAIVEDPNGTLLHGERRCVHPTLLSYVRPLER